MDDHDHHCCDHHDDHAGRWDRLRARLERDTLLALAAFMGFSFLSGRVYTYLSPAYVWLSPVAAVVLLAMWVAVLRGGPSPGCACAHGDEHQHVPRSVCLTMLVVPMVFALVVNPKGMSQEGLSKRRSSARRSDLGVGDRELVQAIRWALGDRRPTRTAQPGTPVLPKEPTVLELLDAVDELGEAALEGKFVTVVGQCDLSAYPEGGRLDLYRLKVVCCVADATSLGVEVVRQPGVQLEPGGWVRVSGILRFDSPRDPILPVIHAVKTAKISEPSEPFL